MPITRRKQMNVEASKPSLFLLKSLPIMAKLALTKEKWPSLCHLWQTCFTFFFLKNKPVLLTMFI